MPYEDWMVETLSKIVDDIGVLPTVELLGRVVRSKAKEPHYKYTTEIANELEQLGQFRPLVDL